VGTLQFYAMNENFNCKCSNIKMLPQIRLHLIGKCIKLDLCTSAERGPSLALAIALAAFRNQCGFFLRVNKEKDVG
jgi:hypothetical protein